MIRYGICRRSWRMANVACDWRGHSPMPLVARHLSCIIQDRIIRNNLQPYGNRRTAGSRSSLIKRAELFLEAARISVVILKIFISTGWPQSWNHCFDCSPLSNTRHQFVNSNKLEFAFLFTYLLIYISVNAKNQKLYNTELFIMWASFGDILYNHSKCRRGARNKHAPYYFCSIEWYNLTLNDSWVRFRGHDSLQRQLMQNGKRWSYSLLTMADW